MNRGSQLRVTTRAVLCLLLVACAPGTLTSTPPGSDSKPVSPAPSASFTSHAPQPKPSPTPSPSPSPKAPVPALTVQAWLLGEVPAPATKQVFLTFDDGPNHTITPQVLDVLATYQVPATFYVLGTQVKAAPDVLLRTCREGHAIGLHSWNHSYSALYPGRYGNTAEIMRQYELVLNAVREVLGPDYTPGSWRYPGGHMSWHGLAEADQALADQGVRWIDWNGLTGDSEPLNRRPQNLADMVTLATTPIREGTTAVVLLAHDADGKELTLQSLPLIIEAYQAAGYTFATIV